MEMLTHGRDQLMLRLASVAVTTPDVEEHVEITVLGKPQLMEPPGRSAPNHQASAQCHRGDENMPDGAFCPIKKLEDAITTAKTTIAGVRKKPSAESVAMDSSLEGTRSELRTYEKDFTKSTIWPKRRKKT